MVLRTYRKSIVWLFTPFLLLAVLACGGPTAPDAPAAEVDPEPVAAEGETPEATPFAEATPATNPPEAITSAGTLNVGQKELGAFSAHPKLAVNPALFVSQTAPLGEGLLYADVDREIHNWLLEDWRISEDFNTWTFQLREGVEFHKGYGEMTAEDVVWSYVEGWAENDPHVRASDFQRVWQAEGGHVEVTDRYTVEVNLGEPVSSDGMVQSWMLTPGGSSNWVASKRQSEEVGEDEANENTALTGSWEIVEHQTAEFWRMRAVEDHWRQTPYFEEMVFWEIPEEASRLAGLQTGQLDTSLIAFDSIQVIEEIPGAEFVTVPGAMEYSLNFYGNYLVEADAGEPPAAYDPAFPWVAASSDINSEEWQEAVKVRKALALAVDRETIIDTVLQGYARPGVLRYHGCCEELVDQQWEWEYDPDRALELLEEAGYPDGFSINMTPAIRAAPAEVEACEAVAGMWTNLGIDVNFQNVPYGTLRPQIVGRTYHGGQCHQSSMRFVVGGLPQATTWGSFNIGVTHPFIEEMTPKVVGAVDNEERMSYESEIGTFLYNNALTGLGLYVVDAVWPAGPNIEPWTEHVKTRDLRNINGYEFIRPRQE